MYLHQKFGWEYTHMTNQADVGKMLVQMEIDQPEILGLDTETDGLHHMVAKPFLFAFGWDKHVYTMDMNSETFLTIKMILNNIHYVARYVKYLFAHNAKFDFHMLLQYGMDFETIERLPWADSITIGRLTNYSDSEIGMSLEELGQLYVDPDAKMAGLVIKKALSQIKADRKKMLMATGNTTELNIVTYKDVYAYKPDLMRNYAADDIVIMLSYVKRAFPKLKEVNPELKTFEQERKLISTVAEIERVGIKIDVEYAIQAREKLWKRKLSLQSVMEEKLGQAVTAGQHKVIQGLFQNKFGITLMSCDESALSKVYKASKNEDARTVAKCILEIRGIENKAIKTYIDGKLKGVVNGRYYPSINNSGTVTGRVTCDLQQQPKEAVSDSEGNIIYDDNGTELFHPRRMFIPDDGYVFVFMDYSQMELRVQAYYTILVMGGDINLCAAYIPFKCYSVVTGEDFDYKNPEHVIRWDSGEWVSKETNESWVPTDLHNITTLNAFEELNNNIHHPDFKHLRRWGKQANFLEVYQGGVNALMAQLEVSEEIAKKLHNGFKKSYLGVADYQKWIARSFKTYRFIENLCGRRYYMSNLENSYKGANYNIQGSCADILKKKEIEFAACIKENKFNAKIALPIHDELLLLVKDDELLPKTIETLHSIMQNVPEIPWIPMTSEVEVSYTNWADKEAYGGE